MSDQNSQQNNLPLETRPIIEGSGGGDGNGIPLSQKPAKMPVPRDVKPTTRSEKPPKVPVARPKPPKGGN